jgi:FkbH-like protein
MMLSWLPAPTNFREDLRAARQAPKPERFERLVRLARHRLGFLETIQLDRALAELAAGSAAEFPRIRLAILASSTIDHVCPAIRVAGLRRELLIEVHSGKYGQYRQDLHDRSSDLYCFAPEIVLFSLTPRDAIARVPLAATGTEAEETLTGWVGELRNLWQKARRDLGAIVLQQTFLDVTDPIFGGHDRLVPGAPSRLVARLNERVAEAASANGVSIVDVARASERDGIDVWFESARWLQAKMEIAPQAAPLYGELVVRIIAAHRGLSKKCLVLDLDNTVWGGVVGDAGLEGIVLGEGSALGEAYLALQHHVRQLKERGVILAVCSKNDPAIAEAAFRDHPEMVLNRSDIAAFQANWNDKAANLEIIAERLNIGLESLVFVDDNPVERARIRQSLPMVAVPELPEDPALYVRCLADAGYFEAIGFTPDDRKRGEYYADNVQREALLQASESMEDFLSGLKMSVAFGPFTPVDLVRITQLINKTNQFNPTTRRYSADEVTALSAPENLTLQFRLSDRFGDNGLVSAMILRSQSEQPDVLDIDIWVMSCRVFGRGLEHEAMNIAVEAALRRGARALRADYIPTAKNAVVSELYPGLGFSQVEETALADGATRWLLNLRDYVPRPTHIARSST